MATDARERILEAACDLIASDGIDDVRIARVATRARASTALVHHYFSTREELLEQALVHSYETAGAERFEEAPEGEDAGHRLGRAIEACLPLGGTQERDWTLWIELWLRAVRAPQLRPLAADLYGRYREWIEAAIEEGVASGEFTPRRDVGELADLVIAVIDGTGVRAMVQDPELDVGRSRRLIVDLLAAELRIDPEALAAAAA